MDCLGKSELKYCSKPCKDKNPVNLDHCIWCGHEGSVETVAISILRPKVLVGSNCRAMGREAEREHSKKFIGGYYA